MQIIYHLLDNASGMYVNDADELVNEPHDFGDATDAMQAAFRVARENGYQATDAFEIVTTVRWPL